jgi:uncharacterized protein YqfA (UPF0365 family)
MRFDDPLHVFIYILVIGVPLLVLVKYVFGLWYMAKLSRTPVTLNQIFAIRRKRINPKDIIYAYITCHRAGIPVSLEQLESMYLSSRHTFPTEVGKLVREAIDEKSSDASG